MGGSRRLEGCFRPSGQGRRQRICHDRFHHRARPPAQRWGAQKGGGSEAIGRSKGGLSTKIHATVDALGNPLGFYLTEGQACELDGADVLLPQLKADTVIADKGFDADKRVLEPLQQAGKQAVIPPKANRKVQREYDKELYKARHLIENFFAKLKLFRGIATRYDKTARNFLAAIHLAASTIWLI
jgi:transposase